ncbi:MAG: SgcJ/EcaC family oxidoreductase [Thermoguttaceae bacterium]
MSSSLSTHVALVRRLIAMVAIVMSVSPLYAVEKGKSEKSDQDAIRAAIDSYVAAYNRGDAKAVAAFWSDSGEWISPSGQRFQGKQAIEKEMQSLFNENKGVRIEVINLSIRMVSPQVAIEEGTVRVIRPSEPPSDSTYLAVDVKEGGRWKLNTVRETDVPETQASSSQLQELAWLVGDWVDESPDADDTVTVTWTKNKTFLTYAFKISEPGSDDALEGTQVIGWDPAAGTIRSWMFDSDGGFGEGTWSKHDNSWVVKFNQVLSDGRKAAATNVYTLVDGSTFTWKSIGRKVDGQFIPNIDEVKMVRKTEGDTAKEIGKAAVKTRNSGGKR